MRDDSPGWCYAAPEGLHDDAVMALALANERARRYVEVGVLIINPLAPREKDPPNESIYGYFERMRKDMDWGWEPVRWN